MYKKTTNQAQVRRRHAGATGNEGTTTKTERRSDLEWLFPLRSMHYVKHALKLRDTQKIDGDRSKI
jgi:hypothetical protein